ncbi:hypothetical protein [Marinifilum flexuosum]|uniref:Uncharacterized protein n=1 Tax=Marinifilum flexuosum TaxID=1117708 RepID=A0A419WXL8_9BACT|nr:hypothetical protein [Marinifilum flexuosum]RKE00191.1 hypothetical protein BXY64_3195 [Marinifilum flexuosum]
MKEKIIPFLVYSLIFSIGIFAGEYILDYFTNADRLSITTEIRDAAFIGTFVSLLLVFVNKFPKASNKN